MNHDKFELKCPRCTDEMSDKKFIIGIVGLLIIFMLIGMLLGYFVGVRIADNFYLPQLEICANSLWL